MRYLLIILSLASCTTAEFNMSSCAKMCGIRGVETLSSEHASEASTVRCECLRRIDPKK